MKINGVMKMPLPPPHGERPTNLIRTRLEDLS